MKRLQALTLTLALAALGAFALTGCPDDDGGETVDDTSVDTTLPEDTGGDLDTSVTDTGGDDVVDTVEPPPELAVAHAWSADGATIMVRFAEAVDTTTGGDVTLYALDAVGGAAVTLDSAAADGDTVTLTPAEALDAGTSYTLSVEGVEAAEGDAVASWSGPVKATVFLNLVWHQHQPSYLDPGKDQLQGPWVRKHATKDYADMTWILRAHPKVHFNVNLTSSLLNQIQLYLDRLGPYVDAQANTVDEASFLAAWAGKTDPWIDLLLEDTPAPADATEAQLGYFYGDTWSCRSISEPLRARFPEYEALATANTSSYTQLDLAELKVWFELAWMDPAYLRGEVLLYDDGGTDVTIDLSDVVDEDADGLFTLASAYADGTDAERLAALETLANRLVAENYKLLKASIEVHKELGWDGAEGQVEVLTTPYFHPILPLLFDTDLAREGQPADTLPAPKFAYPDDAALQIAMAVEFYTGLFGHAPRGMWPSEGSVAEEVVPAFRESGIDWIATDKDVLEKGMAGASHFVPYKVDVDTVVGDGGDTDDEMMIVFRDTDLSDKVGFFYQSNPPEENADDFLAEVVDKAPAWGEAPRLLSVILDGENAWEWYTEDHDAKRFLEGVYQRLGAAYDEGAVVTVTGSEYIDGNAARGVPDNPVTAMAEYEDLFPGSWIGGRFDTWIGEVEENLGWAYLSTARDDIEAARAVLEPIIGMPTSYLFPPDGGTAAELAWWNAWRAMLSAEGSDWFWWYGTDQTSAGGDDTPFDDIYRAQLTAMYGFLNEALTLSGQDALDVPAFGPIIQPEAVPLTGASGPVLPAMDGVFDPDESEWTPPGGKLYDNDSTGAIANPADDIAVLYYAYSKLDGGRIFVGMLFNEDLSAKLGEDYQVVLYTSQGHLVDEDGTPVIEADPYNDATKEGEVVAFTSGGPARRFAMDFSSGAVVTTLEAADGSGGWTAVSDATVNVGGPAGSGQLLELEFYLSDLDMAFGDPLELAVLAVDGGSVLDVAPNGGALMMFADPTKLVTVIMELDVSGDDIPLSTYVSIQDPPPPTGTGTPSIVGAQDEFGNWSPNTVFMKDDGVAPDAEAGDQIWTLGFDFVPGTSLAYKYTIGGEGDSWGGTEEYPLTNRGYDVPSDGTRRVRVRDVFADRPGSSGGMADGTVVTVEE